MVSTPESIKSAWKYLYKSENFTDKSLITTYIDRQQEAMADARLKDWELRKAKYKNDNS